MNTPMIQRLIALNAAFVSNLHYEIDGHLEAARYYKSLGEKSYSLHSYKQADKARGRLKPAVATQVALKAEIRWNDHVARLNRQVGLYDAEVSKSILPSVRNLCK